MSDFASVLLPLVSVLVGAAITYTTNVRQRRRFIIEDVLYQAIADVAVMQASHDWIGELNPWHGATEEEYHAFTSQLGREASLTFSRAYAAARASLAKASAYHPSLRSLNRSDGPPLDLYHRADEIIEALQTCLDHLGSRRRERRVPAP